MKIRMKKQRPNDAPIDSPMTTMPMADKMIWDEGKTRVGSWIHDEEHGSSYPLFHDVPFSKNDGNVNEDEEEADEEDDKVTVHGSVNLVVIAISGDKINCDDSP